MLLLLLLLLHARNAPYVNRGEAMNRRRGWSSLVVTQPSTSHYYCVCVCVCVLLCLVFSIAVRLGSKVIYYQLSPLTLRVTVNSAMSHRPFQIPLCQRSAIFSIQQSPTVCNSCYSFTDLGRMEARVLAVCPGS